MKKIIISLGLVLSSVLGLLAQDDCATGYCPKTILVHHMIGAVSPQTKDITYGVKLLYVTGVGKCWITKNLGAFEQASAYNDTRKEAAGWTWQFDRKQGILFEPSEAASGVTTPGSRFPATTWVSSITGTTNWNSSNDPCTLLLGKTWRLPTKDEWDKVKSNYTGTAWSSPSVVFADACKLKLHNGGCTNTDNGSMWNRGNRGYFWSSTNNSSNEADAYIFYMSSTTTVQVTTMTTPKPTGCAVRCIREI